MLKYTDTQVVFRELPDEVTLAINISNCQNHCKGCHSPYLKKDIGTELTEQTLDTLIKSNEGITAVCFMGEGNDKNLLLSLAEHVRRTYPNMKIGVYSGRETVEDAFFDMFDYVKVGPYIEEFGPLDKKTTNQRMYKNREDITYKFQ